MSLSSLRVALEKERADEFIERLQVFHRETFDEELSTYRAARLLDFFVGALGPPVYNQAIQDARSFLQEKLDDLDVEFTVEDEA